MELDWLKKWNQYSPQKAAIQDGDSGRVLSYQDFFTASCRGAQYLKSRYQIQKGDRVAVLAQNELEYVILFFSLQRLGAILVPINYRLTAREIEHILKDAEPSLVVTETVFASTVSSLFSGSVLSLCDGEESFLNAVAKEDNSPFFDFESAEEDPVMILYTSGTTGAPKGAVLTLKMIFWNSLNTMMRLNISQNDRTVIFLPFFHTGAWNVLTTPFLHRGATVIFLKKFDAEKVLTICEDSKCTILFGVPTTMDMLARSPSFKAKDLSTLRYAVVGGEPMPLPLIQTWHDKSIPIRQGYGLTEFGPNVFSLNEEDALRKMGSIGFPNFYTQVRVVDEAGMDVPPGVVGELWLKGPMCMQGYWKNESATQQTLHQGWLATGDLVRCDEDGYYYVVGRKKEMYKSGGENVYPVEIEKVIRQVPGVLEAAVVGVPDQKWGEVGKAFLVLESATVLDAKDRSIDEAFVLEQIQQHCLQNLAKFKIPKYFQIVSSLPKGDSGKILKRELTH